ncbi:MAG: protein-arginine deiminase [Bradymonadaceae bacterium]|nr:protein-arginine deiminase [Lujinxingiaceae bacterium]
MTNKWMPWSALGPRLVVLFAAVLIAACGGTDVEPNLSAVVVDEQGNPIPLPTIEIVADSNRNGVIDFDDPGETGSKTVWTAAHGAIFLANIDDDMLRCPSHGSDAELAACNDATDEIVNGDDDLRDLARIKTRPWPGALAGAEGRVSIDEAARAHVRLFRNTNGQEKATSFVVFDPENDVLDADALRAGVEFAIEGKDIIRDREVWDGMVDITLSVRAPGILEESSDTVRLRQAPVLLRHHLDPADAVFASSFPRDPESQAFIRDLKRAMDLADVAQPLRALFVDDQWTQDFFENGYMAMPSKEGMQAIQVYFRSANLEYPESMRDLYTLLYQYYREPLPEPLREAGRVVYTELRGPDVAGVTVFSPDKNQDPFDLAGYDLNDVILWLYGERARGSYPEIGRYLDVHDSSDTLDSFGNTETIPPYEHNGVAYPAGRVIRGKSASNMPDAAFDRMLVGQNVQDPIYIDTLWLLVAHVDEIFSYVKADNARGWSLLLNDPVMARQMLINQRDAGHGEVPMFVGKHQAIDYDLCTRAGCPPGESATVTIAEVLDDAAIMAASAEAAIKIDEQFLVFKQATGIVEAEIVRIPFLHEKTYGASMAYQPGTVNGISFNDKHFGSPKPHGPVIGGVDIFEAQMEEALAELDITVHWIENWDLYHLNIGEVHCGSNVERRIPKDYRWWEHAQ